MRTVLLLPLLLIISHPVWASEGRSRLDNRSLRANFRVFLENDEGFRNQVTIVEYGEQTTRFLQNCPEKVQIGGVQIDEKASHRITTIQSNTYISNANISVFCE